MIVNVASWLNLGKNNKKNVDYISIGSLSRDIKPNRIEIEEFETYFTYNLIKIPIQVHIEKTYKNYVLYKSVVNVRDIRLPIENTFLYTEITCQRPPSPFKLINTDKSIHHKNPWVTVFETTDLIRQIEKNNEYLNRIELIKNNF